jgi:hypothetical protein
MTMRDEIELERLAAEARRLGIQPWQLEMSRAVGTDLMRDIVRDHRGGAQRPVSVLQSGPEPVVERGSGWVEPRPLESPAGVAICDRLVDVQDALDRAELSERIAKAAHAERQHERT